MILKQFMQSLNLIVTQHLKKFLSFRRSGLCPVSGRSSVSYHMPLLSPTLILISPPLLRFRLPIVLFVSAFPTKILHAFFLYYSKHAKYPPI
jgi:hypothetical protein